MSTISDTIAATVTRLAELNGIVEREPAFQKWHFAGGTADVSIVQLFPINRELPVEQRQAQARAIARAFGGKWEQDVTDGSWRTEAGSARFHVVLHYVDRDINRVTRAIDLSEPTAPAPSAVVADEPPVAATEPDDAMEEEQHLARD